MDNIPVWLRWVIGIVLTMLIIGGFIVIYLYADGFYSKSKETLISQQQTLSQAEFGNYDNKVVTGMDVIDAVNRFSSRPSFSVHIKTGLNPSGYFAENSYKVSYATPAAGNTVDVNSIGAPQVELSKMQDQKENNYYVNPNGLFQAKIYRDSNKEVRLIEFTQNP